MPVEIVTAAGGQREKYAPRLLVGLTGVSNAGAARLFLENRRDSSRFFKARPQFLARPGQKVRPAEGRFMRICSHQHQSLRTQVHPLLYQTPAGSFRSGWLVTVELCKCAPRHLYVLVENAIRRSLNSCKAAVVGAGLAAAGGKGGARPRRGGAGLLRPGGPTNRPAFGGRAPRPQGAAVGRTAASLAGQPPGWTAGRRLRRAA